MDKKRMKMTFEIFMRMYYARKDGNVMSNAPSFGLMFDNFMSLLELNKDFTDKELKQGLEDIRKIYKFDEKESLKRDEYGNVKAINS